MANNNSRSYNVIASRPLKRSSNNKQDFDYSYSEPANIYGSKCTLLIS
jgi:hypothetical protein